MDERENATRTVNDGIYDDGKFISSQSAIGAHVKFIVEISLADSYSSFQQVARTERQIVKKGLDIYLSAAAAAAAHKFQPQFCVHTNFYIFIMHCTHMRRVSSCIDLIH